ncbi:hypothetical protein GCM10010377_71370 [Streptomyces viridiviolaceus]|nr:hypothetical protein GCM10010377_71370 [Streptomyces viridiviolaceus]
MPADRRCAVRRLPHGGVVRRCDAGQRLGRLADRPVVRDRFGAPDALVNSAGFVDWPGIEDTRDDAWDSVI